MEVEPVFQQVQAVQVGPPLTIVQIQVQEEEEEKIEQNDLGVTEELQIEQPQQLEQQQKPDQPDQPEQQQQLQDQELVDDSHQPQSKIVDPDPYLVEEEGINNEMNEEVPLPN